MTGPPTIRAEHAAAIRAVNARFAALPAEVQASIRIGHDSLEDEVNAAIVAGDRPRAEAAIRAWKQHWLAEFERAAR